MTIEERVEKLELKLDRARFINLLLGAIGIGVLLVLWFFASGTPTAQEKVMDEVLVKQFIVVNDNGIKRAFLELEEDVPGLALFDENGTYRADLLVNDEGPKLTLFNENGNRQALLAVTESGTSLSLCDEKGKSRAGLGVFKDGPILFLFDETGSVLWQVP